MRHTIFPLILVLALAPAALARSVKKPEANIEKRKPSKDADAPIVLTTSAPNFCMFGGKTGKPSMGEAAFKSVVWRSDVVYVGETHDEPLDHMAQFEALKAMRIAHGGKIAVGFEMLDQTLQPVLSDYAEGKLTEEEFLAKVDWKKAWTYDYAMYKPLFDFIVKNKLRALALNVPRTVVKKIARNGLGSLDKDERAFLPADLIITQHKKYNEYLKESFGGHGTSTAAASVSYDNYLASMAAWNEGMGLRIVDFLTANPGYSVLVVAGNGHLLYNAAIPASVKARMKDARQASFLTENAEACPAELNKEHKDQAGYVWYIKHPAKPKPAAGPSLTTATLSVPLSTAPAPVK